MKSKSILLLLLIASFATFFVSCDLLGLEEDDPDDPGEITTEEAKVEVRAASQQLTAGFEDFQTNKSFETLYYLYELLLGDSYKSAVIELTKKSKYELSLTRVLNVFRNPESKRNYRDDFGFYKYNFTTDTIELVKASQDTLQVIFPGDPQALANQQLNAAMTVHNIQMKDVEYTQTVWDEDLQDWVVETENESIPINVDIYFIVDDETIMTANYSATVSDQGRPSAVSATVDSYYGGQLTFSGSGLEYNTTMSFSQAGGSAMAKWDLDLTYTNNQESIEKLSGSYEMYPLSFGGFVNYQAIDQAQKEAQAAGTRPDYDFLNSQLDVEVLHLGLNQVLGNLIYMEYYDADFDEYEAQFAILYEDGSWDWLDDVMSQP